MAGRARAAVAPPHHPQIQAVDHLHHKASQVLLRQPLINRRRQKEPGLAVNRPEVAHLGNILEERSKRALSLSGSPHGVKSDRLLALHVSGVTLHASGGPSPAAPSRISATTR